MMSFSVTWVLWEFFLSYWRFLFIVGISFFVWYRLKRETHPLKVLMRQGVVVLSFYLFLHLFFRPLLWIEPALFILFALVIGGMIWVSRQDWKPRIQRSVFVTGGIFSFALLLSGFFYLYPEAPDVEWFIAQQTPKLLVHSPSSYDRSEAYLALSPDQVWKTKTILFLTGIQEIIVPQTTQIDFISQYALLSGQAFLLSVEGYLWELHPQEQVFLHQGRVPGIPEGSLMTGFFTHPLLNSYRLALQTHLEQQIDSPFVRLAFFHPLNQWVLRHLAQIFPGFFSKNLEHAQLFSDLFTLLPRSHQHFLQSSYVVKEEGGGFFSFFPLFFTNAQVFHNREKKDYITKNEEC